MGGAGDAKLLQDRDEGLGRFLLNLCGITNDKLSAGKDPKPPHLYQQTAFISNAAKENREKSLASLPSSLFPHAKSCEPKIWLTAFFCVFYPVFTALRPLPLPLRQS